MNTEAQSEVHSSGQEFLDRFCGMPQLEDVLECIRP